MAVSVRNKRCQGRTLNAGNPPKPEHAPRKGRAGGSGGNKAVRFAAAHLQHSLNRCTVNLFSNSHHRAFMIGDYLRLLLKRQAVLHVFVLSEERRNLIQFSGQDDLKARILAQCFQYAFHRCFRRQVTSHGIHVDFHQLSPPYDTIAVIKASFAALRVFDSRSMEKPR